MAATTLDAVSGGRFTLGLGVSTAQLAEGLHDVPFEAPISRLRQVVTQVRALLRGDRVPLHAIPRARRLRLDLPGKPELPIYVDEKLMAREWVILGSGSRSSKIRIAPEIFRRIPNAAIVPGLSIDI